METCSPFFQVAEFANIRKQLEVLEDRLDTMVQPRLTDALSYRKVISLFFIFVLRIYFFVYDSRQHSVSHFFTD